MGIKGYNERGRSMFSDAENKSRETIIVDGEVVKLKTSHYWDSRFCETVNPQNVIKENSKRLIKETLSDEGININIRDVPQECGSHVIPDSGIVLSLSYHHYDNLVETRSGIKIKIPDAPKEFWLVFFSWKKIKNHPSDEYHPLHDWYSRGASDGYGDGYWDRSEDADYSEPPEFPSEEARAAYQLGYENGHANGVMDE